MRAQRFAKSLRTTGNPETVIDFEALCTHVSCGGPPANFLNYLQFNVGGPESRTAPYLNEVPRGDTRDEEQAVSEVLIGPRMPNMYDSRVLVECADIADSLRGNDVGMEFYRSFSHEKGKWMGQLCCFPPMLLKAIKSPDTPWRGPQLCFKGSGAAKQIAVWRLFKSAKFGGLTPDQSVPQLPI